MANENLTGSPPEWLFIHLMAKDYGVPPWVVEEECSREWLTHWAEYRMAEAQEQERLARKAEREAKKHGR